MGKIFTFYHEVTIGDMDLFHSMYFTNYFKLQGITRELWVKDCMPNFQMIFDEGFFLITKNAACDYFKGFLLYDRIRIDLQFYEIKRVSVKLLFKFYNDKTGELYADGTQHIVFANAKHQAVRIPEMFLNACLDYKCDESVTYVSPRKREYSVV